MNMLSLSPAALLVALAGTALGQSTDPFPAQFQLSSLLPSNGGDGSKGFVINGIDADDRSGTSVSSAGDVNGDGIDDLIIGAFDADPNGNSASGECYVVFGAVGVGLGGVINLSSLDGTNGFVLNGIDAGDYSGRSVSSAGDVNGDGYDDLIIGATRADPNGRAEAGESYIVFGAANVGAGGVIELSSLNGTNGFILNGIDAGDRSGISVSSVGDINGDGIDDLIIGAADACGYDCYYANAGKSFVVFGAADLGVEGVLELSTIRSFGFTFEGDDEFISSGHSVSSAGDVNGDGIDDLIIGAPNAKKFGLYPRVGGSYVIFGRDTAISGNFRSEIFPSSLNPLGTKGFVLYGIDAQDGCGWSVSSAGDINGDGIDDLIIGAFQAGPNGSLSGESYVVFGAVGMGAGGVIELSSLDGTNGFVLNGIDELDISGFSVSCAGDVNGDGIDDLIIGAPNPTRSGGCYVVFGNANVGFGGVIELSSLNGTNGFVLQGIDVGDNCGWSVTSVGDVNGDRVDDFLIGAPRANPNGNTDAGQSYVIFGQVIGNPKCTGDADGNGIVNFGDITGVLGNWLNNYAAAPTGTGPGDANGDGTVTFADITTILGHWLVVCP